MLTVKIRCVWYIAENHAPQLVGTSCLFPRHPGSNPPSLEVLFDLELIGRRQLQCAPKIVSNFMLH